MLRAVTAPLTDQAIALFHEQGYLVVDFAFDEQLLEQIIAKVQPFYPLQWQQKPTSPTRVMDAWKLVDEARQLAVQDQVLSALQQLFGRQALPFQTLNFPFGTCQAPHSDTIHFNSIPGNMMAGVWVALEDIDENNGPLLYYPGSHKRAELTMQDFALRPTADDYPKYEQCMHKLVKEEKLRKEYGLIKKGHAIIWHANLIHGGEGHWDATRSRHSQVTHYYFADCQYFTPMLSSAEHKHFRNPKWIPASFDQEIAEQAAEEYGRRRDKERAQMAAQASPTLFNRVTSRLFKRS